MTAPWIRVPAGAFLMGDDDGLEDERPAHVVEVGQFEMAAHPVTVAEYARFLEATGHAMPREWMGAAFAAPGLPVVGVSWIDAQAFCDWRGDARLPTEAEWERAARGGRERERYPWGHEVPSWVPQAGRGPLDGPWPACFGEPNGFGLLGIATNVHEWCADWYAHDYYGATPGVNPQGPPSGVRRASRGGAWRHAVTISRSAARSRLDPSFRYTDYGFRVVRR